MNARVLNIGYDSSTQGFHKVLLGKDAVKIENTKSGITVVCSSPDYKVITYNTRSKRYFQSSISDFPGLANDKLMEADRTALKQARWKQLPGPAYRGRHCMIYKFSKTVDVASKGSGSRIVAGTYLVADTFAIDPKIQDLLGRVFQLPLQSGLPICLRFIDADDGYVSPLTVRSITAAHPTREDFVLPPGYKASKSTAVLVDPMSKSVFDGLNDFTERLAH